MCSVTFSDMSTLIKKLESKVIETRTQDVFTDLNSKRRDWKVTGIPKENFKIPSIGNLDKIFARITAIALELELPVGSFIRAALETDGIPPTAYKGMIANIIDEEKHDKAFKEIAKIYIPTTEDKAKAREFRIKAVQYRHYNPIAKSRDLETIVFLTVQGIMRFYGGQSLERVIADISHDEYRHTNYGWRLSTVLKIGRDNEFEELCRDIVDWVIEPFDQVSFKSMWEGIRDEMLEQGYSDKLSHMLNYGLHRAPFELSNAYY